MKGGLVVHHYAGEVIPEGRIQRLKDYDVKDTTTIPKRVLRTNTKDYDGTVSACKVFVQHDYPVDIPYRGGSQLVVKTVEEDVLLYNNSGKAELFCLGNAFASNMIVEQLQKIMALGKNHFGHLSLTPTCLAKIVHDDCNDLKNGWWDDLDSNTKKAFLKGKLDRSKIRKEFDLQGKCTGASFESAYLHGRTVRVTCNGSVTIYGKDASPSIAIDYFENIIKPALIIELSRP